MLPKFMKIMLNSEQAENKKKNFERKKNGSPKEQVENTDLYKPVLNKIMTTQEQCVKQFLSSFKSIPERANRTELNFYLQNF